MQDFVRTDPSVTRRIVHYSILLRNIKVALLQLRFTKLMISDLHISSLNCIDLTETELKLIHYKDEVQHSCRLLLEPLLEGIDFGHKFLNHWAVSMTDIKRGYCELEEILPRQTKVTPQKFGRRFILLLEDYKDEHLGFFRSGELISINTAVHFIDNIPEKKDVFNNQYDAVINNLNLAMRNRTLIIP